MHTVARTIVGACLAVAVIAPVSATAAPAAPSARAKQFKVMQTFQKAKLGVCKVSVGGGTAWRVYGRLDTRKVKAGKYSGSLYVYETGKELPVAQWRSPMTKKGKLSKVGSVRLPNKPGFVLDGGIGAANMGNGGAIKIANVRKC